MSPSNGVHLLSSVLTFHTRYGFFNVLIRSTTNSSGGTGAIFLFSLHCCDHNQMFPRSLVCHHRPNPCPCPQEGTILLVLKPVPWKSQDVLIILTSLRLGRGHFDPTEGPDGCVFLYHPVRYDGWGGWNPPDDRWGSPLDPSVSVIRPRIGRLCSLRERQRQSESANVS